jgi:WD40 repeat protein
VSAFSHMIISFFFQRFHIKISVRNYTESLQISRRERLNESNNENLSRETDTFSVRIWIRESHRECKPRIPPGKKAVWSLVALDNYNRNLFASASSDTTIKIFSFMRSSARRRATCFQFLFIILILALKEILNFIGLY